MGDELRELDALVAEKVMGWQESIDYDYHPPQINWASASNTYERVKDDPRNPPTVNSLSGWKPSSDVVNAMEVVEKIRSTGLDVILATEPNQCWSVAIEGNGRAVFEEYNSLPFTICRAALAAIENE